MTYIFGMQVHLETSDVTIIEIEIEMAIFKGKSKGINIRFFGASVTRFLHCITLEGPANCAGCHRIAFTPPSRESIHAKCGGVYIYDSEYWGGNRNQINVEFFLEKVN